MYPRKSKWKKEEEEEEGQEGEKHSKILPTNKYRNINIYGKYGEWFAFKYLLEGN